jgi:hypothetical protein
MATVNYVYTFSLAIQIVVAIYWEILCLLYIIQYQVPQNNFMSKCGD